MKINSNKLFIAWVICFVLYYVFRHIGVEELKMVFLSVEITMLVLLLVGESEEK